MKNIIIFIIFGIVIITLVLILNGGKESIRTSRDEKSKNKEIVLKIDSNAEMVKSCDNIEELQEKSDLIIQGMVEDIEPYCDDTATVYSNYKIKIVESIRGDLDKNDTITVSDFGGVIPAKEYIKYQKDPKALVELEKYDNLDNKYVEYSFEGAWRPQKGETYIWYLETNKVGNQVFYNPVNAYQGILDIDGNKFERYCEDEDDSYQVKFTRKEIINNN